jgi:hypothetical protein
MNTINTRGKIYKMYIYLFAVIIDAPTSPEVQVQILHPAPSVETSSPRPLCARWIDNFEVDWSVLDVQTALKTAVSRKTKPAKKVHNKFLRVGIIYPKMKSYKISSVSVLSNAAAKKKLSSINL